MEPGLEFGAVDLREEFGGFADHGIVFAFAGAQHEFGQLDLGGDFGLLGGFLLLEVEVDLLEDILGLEGDHPGFMLKLADGGLELRLGDVLQDAFSVPPPGENLGLGSGQHGGFFSVDLVILESDVAAGGDVDASSFSDLELGLCSSTGSGY